MKKILFAFAFAAVVVLAMATTMYIDTGDGEPDSYDLNDIVSITFSTDGNDIINVTHPTSSTVWNEGQTNTYVDWNNATGSQVMVEIYKDDVYVDIYHDWTANDGHAVLSVLGDWGTGDDFQLKVIDENDNYGWSEAFTIEGGDGTINITYPTSSTVWTVGQTNTYIDWNNASGDQVLIEIYKGGIYVDEYHPWTANDGHAVLSVLGDWGTGDDFQLKVIDENDNYGWSEAFTIE